MDFNKFLNDLINDLKNYEKKCIKILENNKKLIEAELSKDSNQEKVDRFITEFNDAVLQDNKKYKYYESVLKHDSMKYILSVFQNSDILIQACKFANEKAAEWLLTMNINPYIQDKNGMTALMHAVKNAKPQSVISKHSYDFKCLNIEDYNGNNVLFYAIGKPVTIIRELMKADVNHINHDGETVLLYCCKNKLYDSIKMINESFHGIDLNITDNTGKTAMMYIAEYQKALVFTYFNIYQRRTAFNYVTDQGESVLSVLLKNMYGNLDHPKFTRDYVDVIVSLIKGDADFNVVVDEDGNTALMVFLLAGDYETFYYVTSYTRYVDFAKKNKHGESVTSLFLKLGVPTSYKDENKVYSYITSMNSNLLTPSSNTTLLYSLDYNYVDSTNKNTALILATINSPYFVNYILQNNYKSINAVNAHQENALIIAAKLNKHKVALLLLKKGIDVHQKDDTGNTALHYAIQNKNVPLIHELVMHGADITIENNESETALTLAKKLDNSKVLKALHGSLSNSELDKAIEAEEEVNMIVQNKRIEEYLYIGVSNLYVKISKNDLENIKILYNFYIKAAERKLNTIEHMRIHNVIFMNEIEPKDLSVVYNNTNLLNFIDI